MVSEKGVGVKVLGSMFTSRVSFKRLGGLLRSRKMRGWSEIE